MIGWNIKPTTWRRATLSCIWHVAANHHATSQIRSKAFDDVAHRVTSISSSVQEDRRDLRNFRRCGTPHLAVLHRNHVTQETHGLHQKTICPLSGASKTNRCWVTCWSSSPRSTRRYTAGLTFQTYLAHSPRKSVTSKSQGGNHARRHWHHWQGHHTRQKWESSTNSARVPNLQNVVLRDLCAFQMGFSKLDRLSSSESDADFRVPSAPQKRRPYADRWAGECVLLTVLRRPADTPQFLLSFLLLCPKEPWGGSRLALLLFLLFLQSRHFFQITLF